MSFVKHSTQTFLVRITMVAFGLVAGIINARWLGPEGVGIIALVMLIREFTFRFGNLGFGSAFSFYVAKRKISAQRIMKLLWVTGTFVSVISTIVVLTIWRSSFSPWNDMQPGLFYLSLPLIAILFFDNYMQRVLSGELKINEINIANIIMSSSYVLFLIILVILLKTSIRGAIISLVLSNVLSLIYLFLQCNKFPADAHQTYQAKLSTHRSILDLWRYGRWNYLIMFANFFIEELPLIILKKFSTHNVPIGLFARAKGLGKQSHLVAFPISTVLFPYTAASEKSKATNRTNVLCRNSLLLMLIGVGLAVLFAKPLIVFLYGQEFRPAATIFYALAPGVAFWPMGHFLAVHVAASGKPKAVFIANLITTIAAAVMCCLLIPRYGAVGAGLSTTGIYLTRCFSQLVLYVKVTGSDFSKVILLCRSDWKYYKYTLKGAVAKFIRKSKSSNSAEVKNHKYFQ